MLLQYKMYIIKIHQKITKTRDYNTNLNFKIKLKYLAILTFRRACVVYGVK